MVGHKRRSVGSTAPILCFGPEGGVVVIFDRAVECDIAKAFPAFRASRRIADDADAVGGEAVNAKPIIDPNTKISNRQTVGDATGLRVAVGGLCSARGSPVLRLTGVSRLAGLRRIDRGPPRAR